ncbi:MAG: hypothetical protein ACRDHG_04945, partial [Anaerolineales bacterium]
MDNALSDLFPMVLLGCVSALGLAPLAARAAVRFGLIDVPGSAPHKTHPAATPLVGGPILAIAVAVACLVGRPPLDRQTVGILIAGVMILVSGLVDDRFRIPP